MKRLTSNTKRWVLASLAAAALCANSAMAQSAYPNRPILMVVPQAAGGTNDIVGRIVSQKLGEVLNTAVAVENRPGAGGNVGTQFAAKANKDGYTLLMTISSSQAINPALYKNPGFDPVKDFKPVSLIGSVPNVLLAHPDFPAKSMKDLIQMAKAKPGHYQYASAGNGTLNHLLGEMLNSMASIDLQHVPYKGVAPALNDVLGGQLPLVFASLPASLSHIKAGKLKPLAVSSPKRSPALPDVPALAESVPGYRGTLWIGLFAPRGTPDIVVQRLRRDVARVLSMPELAEAFTNAGGIEPFMTSPEEMNRIIKRDQAKYSKLINELKLKID